MEFNVDHVGSVSEVRYFMNKFTLSSFSGRLTFSGCPLAYNSCTSANWVPIFVVGNEINEGWNYRKFSTPVKYRSFRFSSNIQGGCNIGEVRFRGVEVIDDNNPTKECPVRIVLNGAAPVQLTSTVSYHDYLTPTITSISPRYGKV